MRQLLIQVPIGKGKRVTSLAEEYDPVNVVLFQADTLKGRQDVIILHVDNRSVGPLLDDLSEVPEGQITLDPNEMLTMKPPDDKVAESIEDVKQRSPVEVWLNGLQSIGSWKGFLGYAVAAGIVVWIGLYTNTVYLLVAAMLIAPFGGPAMNASLASASGDRSLLQRSLKRYVVGLLTLMLTTYLVSLALQLDQITSLMLSVGQLSAVAAMLPTVTGAVGALNLIQPDRSSLVPGTAVGLLVAASLAPPAGVAGMAVALQNWSLVTNALFVLMLQLVMINLSGALVFRLHGSITHEGSRYQRGKHVIFLASLGISVALGVGLLWFQFRDTPDFQRTTRAQRAAAETEQLVEESELAEFISANYHFVEPSPSRGEILLGTVYVKREEVSVLVPEGEVSEILTREIQNRLLEQGFNVTPLLNVIVLDPPEQEQ